MTTGVLWRGELGPCLPRFIHRRNAPTQHNTTQPTRSWRSSTTQVRSPQRPFDTPPIAGHSLILFVHLCTPEAWSGLHAHPQTHHTHIHPPMHHPSPALAPTLTHTHPPTNASPKPCTHKPPSPVPQNEDKNRDDPKAADKFMLVNKAKVFLSDDVRTRMYVRAAGRQRLSLSACVCGVGGVGCGGGEGVLARLLLLFWGGGRGAGMPACLTVRLPSSSLLPLRDGRTDTPLILPLPHPPNNNNNHPGEVHTPLIVPPPPPNQQPPSRGSAGSWRRRRSARRSATGATRSGEQLFPALCVM